MTEELKIEVKGYEVIEKRVNATGSSGRVYVPKKWVGKRVKVILLEKVATEE
jgi:putative transposon-encoded protein